MSRVLAACGGFLLAVLWMDLMFDVQVLRINNDVPSVREEVVASIAGYYRRVTTDAYPMNRLIGAVMVVTVLGSLYQALRVRARRWLPIAAVLLSWAPVALALVRVFPNAVRLGARTAPIAVQADLASAIFRDHVFCLVAMSAFTAIQLGAQARGGDRQP